VIKVIGACTLSREPYPFPDIWAPLARVFAAWGFDRCLRGTDWTHAFAVVNYAQAVEPFRQTDRGFPIVIAKISHMFYISPIAIGKP
jgi:hypothetical protein